jgi:hypothetical protein
MFHLWPLLGIGLKFSLQPIIAVLMFVCLAGSAEAGCSSISRSIAHQTRALDGSGGGCVRALGLSGAAKKRICSACRNSVLQILEIERVIRANRSCFSGRDGYRLVADFNQAHTGARYFRRYCGY